MAPDKMMYFGIRARGEAIRMLYAIAGEKLTDERLSFEDWPAKKTSTPLGQIPVLTTSDGVLVQSNTIARHVAKKFGLVGSGLWNEALNDVILETMQETINALLAKVTPWKVLKMAKEPENSEQIIQDIRTDLLKKLTYIKSLSDQKGKKFLLSDKIQLADVWLYTALELASKAFSDALSITPWIKEFCSNFESDPKMKKYLAARPSAPM